MVTVALADGPDRLIGPALAPAEALAVTPTSLTVSPCMVRYAPASTPTEAGPSDTPAFTPAMTVKSPLVRTVSFTNGPRPGAEVPIVIFSQFTEILKMLNEKLNLARARSSGHLVILSTVV